MNGMKIRDVFSAITSIIPGLTVQRILISKLGLDRSDVPYYLHLLNLNFGDNEEEKEASLNKFRLLALYLKRKPRTIRKLIKCFNWRSVLVGNAVVILLRAKEYQKDLIWRLENETWVSPQLAVGIALLDDGLAEKELHRIIETATEESYPKTIMSAYISLKFLESPFANDFEKTDLFKILKAKDYDNSIGIAEHHWNFWKNIEPI